ncbi:MAG: hypothetical protein WBA89_26660 [Microcoleus sp.]|uniref:hypothetical protein n=1 Tax=Microcoleus sp. TaxID=44472 RepID=UPI003C72F3FC
MLVLLLTKLQPGNADKRGCVSGESARNSLAYIRTFSVAVRCVAMGFLQAVRTVDRDAPYFHCDRHRQQRL